MNQEFLLWREQLREGARGELGTDAYKDVATCPICIGVLTKPDGPFTERELKHIQHHIQSPLIEDVVLHCIHRIHGFAWCCLCSKYDPERLTIELSIRGLQRSSRDVQKWQTVISH